MPLMPDKVMTVKVTPEARAKVIGDALKGRVVKATMTAGQRRAVQAAEDSRQAS